MIEVTIISPSEILYQGQATSVVLPGEQGVFEVLSFHKPILSRLIPGCIMIDDQMIPIWRGVVKVASDSLTAIVETKAPK
jgi:F-type H+-transporting ATPase subunit epsilon